MWQTGQNGPTGQLAKMTSIIESDDVTHRKVLFIKTLSHVTTDIDRSYTGAAVIRNSPLFRVVPYFSGTRSLYLITAPCKIQNK